MSDLTSAKGFSRKITHLESSVLTRNKTQISKQQMNDHETSYQCHCYLWKKFLNACHFTMEVFLDDSLKFVDNSSVSALANDADMRMCACVSKKWVCVCVCVCMRFVEVCEYVLLERSFRQCSRSVLPLICRPLSCIYGALSFCCCLPLPRHCRVWALCWIFHSALGSFPVRFRR